MVLDRHFEENDVSRCHEALLEIADLAVHQSTLAELSRELTKLLHRYFSFQIAGSYLHDPSKDVMRLMLWESPQSADTAMELPIEGSTSGWVWQNQRPLVLTNLEEENRFAESQKLFKGMGVRALCEVPLTAAQRRIGVLSMASNNGHVYCEQDVQLLSRIANSISSALQNVLTSAALQHEKERLEALLNVSTALMASVEVDEIVPAISDFLQRVIEHDFASVALYEEGSKELRVYALDAEVAGDSSSAPGGLLLPISDPSFLHGEAKMRNREELLEMGTSLDRMILERGIQSLCSLPLISRRGTLGVLHVGSRQTKAFLSQDLVFLRQVAAQIAGVLDNASAYREVKKLSRALSREKLYLQDEIRSVVNFDEIIGDSPALKRLLTNVQTVSPSDASVLILGETGTGKELVARAIHRLSGRAEASFIKLNCAAIPTGLLESELFGHEKGAFTGAITQKIGRLELADKGTLFLDEVGEIPLELQPKLLRVLQDQEFERLGGNRTIKVDIRLIAATNQDLPKRVANHEFRSDLYYRLNVFPIRVPTLRERSRDIPLLVRYFVQKFSKRMNKKIEMIPAETMRTLEGWQWPGNVRELENFIERSVILSEGSSLSAPLAELIPMRDGCTQGTTLEDLEREHILRVLRETGGVIAGVHGAAARLGMKRTTLQSRIQRLGITRAEYEN
ncbi:MAG TPA: sigma 54-interacting transcriptional regulator [Terriglobales bacterium]|nr:sigma 54-interacting transcriptional regulator [Terriglobales bacterium]